MEAITVVNILVILIMVVANQLKVKRNVLPGVVAILIMFFGIRYRYGNDFFTYSVIFNKVASMSYNIARLSMPDMETGWILLNKLFAPLGFPSLIFFLTAVQFSTAGWFIAKYVDRKYQWAIMALYLFWPNLMLTDLSMLRQSLAISVIMMASPCIFKKRWIRFLLFVFIATQFHRSAYIGLTFPLIFMLRNIKFGWAILVYVGLLTFFMALPSSMLSVIESFLKIEEFEKYSYYRIGGTISNATRSGAGFWFGLVIGLYTVYILRWKSTGNRFFVLMLATYYAISPLSGTLGVFVRFFFYFHQFGIIGFEEIIKRTRRDPIALALITMFFFVMIFTFVQFFTLPIYTRYYLHYRTIFQ